MGQSYFRRFDSLGNAARVMLLAIALGLAPLCSAQPVADSAPPPIKLGATLALTGKLAPIGTEQLHGLQLAIREINAGGGIEGRPIELVVEDNSGDAKSALQGMSKLLDRDKVEILFSSFTHITQAIKDRVKRADIVMLYAASLGTIAVESPLAFRDWGDAEAQGKMLAKAVAQSPHRSVAVLTETSEGCEAIVQSYRSTAQAAGIRTIAEEAFSPGETDFRPLLLRLSQKKPEALVFCTWRDGALVMRQMKELGLIGIPTFQYLTPFLPESDTAEARKLYEENRSVVVWLGYVETELTDLQKQFFESLKVAFGSPPKIEAALAYDDLHVLAAAMRRCRGTQAECVAKALLATDYVGAAGRIRFDEYGRSNREDLLIQVINGQWHSVPGSRNLNAQ